MKNEDGFKRYSRGFNIDLAAKILFSQSMSVDNLIRCQVSSYLEFNNVTDNFFYSPNDKSSAETVIKDMVKIPFSKSEIFTNTILTFKEKRQLVKAIEMCLEGADSQSENKVKPQNSTHEYQKDISLTEVE